MPLVTLPAHFDGNKICLDESFPLHPNARLMVVILPEQKKESPSCNLHLGELPELFESLPHLSHTELADFEKDIHEIQTQFNQEELTDPWES